MIGKEINLKSQMFFIVPRQSENEELEIPSRKQKMERNHTFAFWPTKLCTVKWAILTVS